MIKKDKIQEILNKKEMNEFPVENDYFQQVSKKNTSLMVVICKESRSLYFQVMKQDSDVLFCEDLRYIVSINHLENVKDIFLDVESFTDLDEIYYLVRQFYILHPSCNVVLIGDNDFYSITDLKIRFQEMKEIYYLNMEDIDQDYRTKIILLADKEITKSQKKRKKINLKIVLVFFLIGFITPIMAGYIYREYNKTTDIIHNNNMNVQLDMGSDMILPINTVYTDETGSHIIIEDVAAKDSELTIELYDDDHNKLNVEKKMIECPDKKCTRHYDLVFSLNKDSDYYILQMDNSESIKNVEIDDIYFK